MNSLTKGGVAANSEKAGGRGGTLLLGGAAGVLAALLVLLLWLPGMALSIAGAEPKVYWYLSRASAVVAYALLWLSMAVGLGISNKLVRVWPGAPGAFDLHQHFSLLGLGFAVFHALALLGDRYINYTVAQLLLPFGSTEYRQAWVGLGQIGLYLMALVTLTFYIRKRIGHRSWRIIHFASFAVFVLALLHGIWSGTDTGSAWAAILYWSSGGSLIFLTAYRVMARAKGPRTAPAKRDVK